MQDDQSRRALRVPMPWLASIRQRKRQQNGVGSRLPRSQKVVGARIYVYASRANRLLIHGKLLRSSVPKSPFEGAPSRCQSPANTRPTSSMNMNASGIARQAVCRPYNRRWQCESGKSGRKAHSVIRLTLQGDFASRAEDAHCTCHHSTEVPNRCTAATSTAPPAIGRGLAPIFPVPGYVEHEFVVVPRGAVLKTF